MDDEKQLPTADDWLSYAIPTDAQMLATHNANEIRKQKHLVGILHNMVLDKNYHGAHEANTLRKQHNEHAKTLSAVVAKLAEAVQRIVDLEAEIATMKERQHRQANFLNTLRKKGDSE